MESGQLGGGLAGTAHIETPFCHLVSHVFLEKILTSVSESGQVGRASIETSFLSSRFSSADLEEIVTGVIESGQAGGWGPY